jgi:hypothetical protein
VGTTKTKPAADAPSAEDVQKAERAAEKLRLIDEMAILDLRKDAIEEARDEKKKRLMVLMSEDGDRKLTSEWGDAQFKTKRLFKVHDPSALLRLFPAKTLEEVALFLAERFKPTAEFADGVIAAGLDLTSAVTVGLDESMTVERARTKAAKAKQKQIIEQTRREAQENVEALAKTMRQGANTKKGAK